MKRAFTLVELMIVIVIISILMGLTLAGSFKAIESSKKSKAESAIATLETALAMYESDVGSYPFDSVTNGSGNIFKTWLQVGDGAIGWHGPYMTFRSEDLSGNSYLDPWGVAYKYTTNPPVRNPTFDIEDGSLKSIDNW